MRWLSFDENYALKSQFSYSLQNKNSANNFKNALLSFQTGPKNGYVHEFECKNFQFYG